MVDLLVWELAWVDRNVTSYKSVAHAESVKFNITKRYLTMAIARAIKEFAVTGR